jgi:oligoendopeptidase F
MPQSAGGRSGVLPRWNLADIVPGGPEKFDALLGDLAKATTDFEGLRARLTAPSRDEVAGAMRLLERAAALGARAGTFSYLAYTADTRDQKAKALLDRAEDARTDSENRTLFFRLWWINQGGAEASALAPEDPDHRYYLDTLRKMKPHVLDERVEQAVNLKNTTGFSGWTIHYDQITSAFTYTLKIKGRYLRGPGRKPARMVTSELSKMFTSSDPARREAAYKAVLEKYRENGAVLGEIYRTIARDWRNEYLKLRNYGAPIEPRNLENDVPNDSVDALLRSCTTNSRVFQEFFMVKAKSMRSKKLSRYHIYAPLGARERSVAFAEGVREVLRAFSKFDARFAQLAKRVFDSGHADAGPRPGKRGGAYCASVTPDEVPFLFLNFSGNMRDVYTIAHESGHAVHSQLAAKHSMLTFHPPLVLAETASVFGEMILFDELMADEDDPETKRALLSEKITSMYSTIVRQASFVSFEVGAHERVAEGATVDELSAEYIRNLRIQFGSSVEVTDDFMWEWTYIPHIYHTPFYCYAYAFGNLLTLALYERYRREGRDFVPRYLELLSWGGSRSPADALEDLGMDISSQAFWDSGFGVVSRMVDELKKI